MWFAAQPPHMTGFQKECSHHRLPPAKDDHEPMVVATVNVFGPVSWASWLHTGFECRGHLHERNGLIEQRQ